VGATARAVIDFAPGSYAVLGEPFQRQPNVELEVIPGPSTPAPEPAAEAMITIGDGAVAGVPERVPAGEHLWEVTGAGAGPHRFQLFSYPEPITLDQLIEAAALPEGATPAPGMADLALLAQLGGLGVLSSGLTAWPIVDVEPGTYVAACTLPDESGIQHFLTGEITLFTVES
jgi:hypothetical protein